jgi:hypothetical protein
MFPLLGGVPTVAATAAMNGHALLINQTENSAIVKVAEWCGNGSFKDEYGHCRYWGYESTSGPAHEGCPPNRHYEPWVYHSGGRCVPNY